METFKPSFKPQDKIAKTNMSTVYLETTPGGEKIIVKCLNEKSDKGLKRFFREIGVLQGLFCDLDHPHIVKGFGYDIEHDPPYFTMEYLEGGSLDDRLKEGGILKRKHSIPWDEALRLFAGPIDALEVLHAQEIVHRDIKPSNFLFSGDGILKVSDFGIARYQGDVEIIGSVTEADSPPRTSLYSPPEVLDFQGGDPVLSMSQWKLVDIFALGVTLYETITGQYPYAGTTYSDIVYHICKGQFQTPHELDDSIPQILSDMIVEMMQPDKNKRVPDLASVRKRLARISGWAREEKNIQSIEFEPKFSWPCEEEREVVPDAIKDKMRNIERAISMMTKDRQKKARLLLAHYAQKEGDLKTAKKHYLDGKFMAQVNYLNLLEQRKRAPMDWLKQQKKQLQQTMRNFSFTCQQCKAPITQKDLESSVSLFHKTQRKIGSYHDRCISEPSIPCAQDWYGRYELRNDGNKKCLVHIVPMIHEGITNFGPLLERYKRGIEAAYQLKDCPWILTVAQPKPIEDSDSCSFLLAYRPFISLANLVVLRKDKPIERDVLYFILFEIARALEVFQSMNYIHRFLSPTYVHIGIDGQVSLGGFHIAKPLVGGEDHWQSLSFQGSSENFYYAFYCSPEHTKGLSETTAQTDVWTWGVIAYQLLTRSSLHGITNNQHIRSQLQQYASNPSQFRYEPHSDIPKGLNEIMASALQADPKKRLLPGQLVGSLIDFIENVNAKSR